ncbi:MAG: glycosyltransferase family 39 protein [Patescibacteria group bacterium]
MKKNIFLILILLFFLVTRLYKIASIPSSVYWDEASIGYNAYSVLKTGRDEWGEFLPLHFRAFGEFKLPVYIYSVLIVELVFGLTQFAVRFPAVIYGLFSVLGLYLLTNKITKNKTVALLSSFLFSLTPWFFIFSRTGYEAVAGLVFFIFAIYFLLLSFEKNRNLIISIFLFISAIYSYNSFRILTPIFLIPGLIVFGFKTRRQGVLVLLISVGLFILSLLPIYKLYSQDSGLNRLQTVKATQSVIKNYLTHLSFDFLFIKGDSNPRSQIPQSPELFLIDLPFIVLGLFYIFKKRSLKYYAILATLLVSFIPAAITKESPHALRSILAAPIFAVITSLGVFSFISFFKKYSKYLLAAIVSLYLIYFGSYFYKFITKYNLLTSTDWQYQYKLIFANQKEGLVTDKYAQPYIFALFYLKYPPERFRETVKYNSVDKWGFSLVSSFDDFQFK